MGQPADVGTPTRIVLVRHGVTDLTRGSLSCVEVWADGGASVTFVNDTNHLR